MTRTEVLDELEKLPMGKRLAIAEAALHLIREELRKEDALGARTQRAEQLAAAAKALLPDCAAGSELTAFTSLDSQRRL